MDPVGPQRKRLNLRRLKSEATVKVLDSYKEKQEGDRVTMGDKVVRLKRELKYQGTILKIYEDTVLANGHEAHWDFIHHDGAAAVVPVTDDGKILMVRQYRNALNRETLEIPAGKLDAPDEPKIECAYRELEEETGEIRVLDESEYHGCFLR